MNMRVVVNHWMAFVMHMGVAMMSGRFFTV